MNEVLDEVLRRIVAVGIEVSDTAWEPANTQVDAILEHEDA